MTTSASEHGRNRYGVDTTAHVYRHRYGVADIPDPDHAAVVLSAGPYVVVYGSVRDGWHEWGGGYNMVGSAVADAAWLAGDA